MPRFNFYLLFAFAALTCVVSFSTQSEARSIFDILFGREEEAKGPPPEVTLQAPFVTHVPADAQNNKLMEMYGKSTPVPGASNTLDMEQPHRSPEEISRWGSGAVAQALTISSGGWEKLEPIIRPDFSAYGLKEYRSYLDSMHIFDTLSKNNLRVQTISDGSAQVLREGVIDGTYHWLVQVPVMATFYNQALKSIKDKRQKVGQNQEMIIQIQIGRTNKKDKNDIGVEIERWIVTFSQ
ncbi:MAG: DotI/IcmL family type IV secretion protein [Alphaproteobacteria bacterium]|nr:DotI/IcmL family type IV secretion protein [Alphaproteobacteria bacterium]